MPYQLSFDEIRRRALRAAAAAAGAGMLACSSTTPATDAPDVSASDAAGDAQLVTDATSASDASVTADSAAPQDSAAVDSAGEDVATADAPTASDALLADVTTSDVPAADVASTDTVAADSGAADTGCQDLEPGAPNCVDKQNSPDLMTCCEARLKWCNTQYAGDQKAVDTCQFGANYSGKCTGCIPWGPPAPPRFDLAWRPRVEANGPVFEVV